MSTANSEAVSAALEQALSTDEAGSQSATESPTGATTPAEEIVAQAAAEATKPAESPSAETTGAKTVPYDRFSEVVGQKNAASERLEALEAQFKSATDREDTLRNQLGSLEQDHQVLEAIRDLGRDDKYSDAVAMIDRALQGIEEEEVVVEAAKEAGDVPAAKVAESKLVAKTEELETMLNDQRVEALWDKSQTFADALLDTLPEEYTDVDKARLSQMWTPRVDWNAIEEGGAESISEHLNDSFAGLIKEYGAPNGAIASQVRDEVTSQIPEDARPSTPEAVVEGVMGKDWAATNEDGKAVLSDDEFASDVAKLLRATRQG
jgi:hypothetical protein